MSEANIEVSPGNQAGYVTNRQSIIILRILQNAHLRGQCGEGVGSDLGSGLGNGCQQRGLTGVGISHQSDFGEHAQFEHEITLVTRLSGLGVSGCLSGGGGEIAITKTAAPSFAQDKAFSVLGEIADALTFLGIAPLGPAPSVFLFFLGAHIQLHGLHASRMAYDRPIGSGVRNDRWILDLFGFGDTLRQFRFPVDPPDDGSTRHLDNEVFAGLAIHALAHAALTTLCHQVRDEELLDQVVEIVVCLQDHIAASAAIATAGATFGNVSFAVKGDGTFSSMTGTGGNFDLINEHNLRVGRLTENARLRGAKMDKKGRGLMSLAQESFGTMPRASR